MNCPYALRSYVSKRVLLEGQSFVLVEKKDFSRVLCKTKGSISILRILFGRSYMVLVGACTSKSVNTYVAAVDHI